MSQKTVINLILSVFLLCAVCLGFACTGRNSDELATASNISPAPADATGTAFAPGLTLASQDVTPEKRVELIKEHVVLLELRPISILKLEDKGERAPIETIHGSKALQMASMFYCYSTLDFSVSVDEIVKSGFWPFDEFPSGLDRDSLLYDFSNYIPALASDHELAYGNDVNSPRWLTSVRKEILEKYYYSIRNMDDPAAVLNFSRVPEFWINPYSNLPMKASDSPGDYVKRSLHEIVNSVPGVRLIDVPTEIQVDCINHSIQGFETLSNQVGSVSSIGQSEEKLALGNAPNPCATYSSSFESKNLSDAGDKCCVYQRKTEIETDTYNHELEWCCRCTDTTNHCCTFTWSTAGMTIKTYWKKVGTCLPCDEIETLPGQIVRSSGQFAPDTIVAWQYMLSTPPPLAVCDPSTHCIHTADPCWNNRSNFWDSVLYEDPQQTGGGTSYPGNRCDC